MTSTRTNLMLTLPRAVRESAELDRILDLMAALRERDSDPAYADAPVESIYARISKVNKRADGEKPAEQVVKVLEAMLRRHVRLGKIYADANKSAWQRDGKRPGFDAAIDALLDGECDSLAARFLDRMLRQSWTLENIIRRVDREARMRDIRLWSDGREWTFNLSDRMQLRLLTMMAQNESDVKSARIQDDIEFNLQKGLVIGGSAGFGHRDEKTEVSDDQLAAERDAVRWAIEAVNGGASWRTVALNWHERGLRTRFGVTFNPLKARQALVSPRHGGYIERNGALYPRVDADQVRIVDDLTFKVFRARLASRKRGRPVGTSTHFAAGLINCDECGTAMVGGGAQYRCPIYGCGAVTIDRRVVESYMERLFIEVVEDPQHAVQLTADVRELADLDRRIGALDDMLTDLHGKWMRASRTGAGGPYSAMMEDVEIERQELIAERTAIADATAGQVAARATDNARQLWDCATTEERRSLLSTMVKVKVYVAKLGKIGRFRDFDATTRIALHERGKATERITAWLRERGLPLPIRADAQAPALYAHVAGSASDGSALNGKNSRQGGSRRDRVDGRRSPESVRIARGTKGTGKAA